MKRIVVLVALLLTVATQAMAGSACDLAAQYEGKALQYNIMCWWDILTNWE